MNHSQIRKIAVLCGGALLVAGCSAESDAEPSSAETVTQTVTASPSADPQADESTKWLLEALESTSGVVALRDVLAAEGLECMNVEPETLPEGTEAWYIYCDPNQDTVLEYLVTPDSERPAEEAWNNVGDGIGVAHTEWFSMKSTNQEHLDLFAEVLEPLDPEVHPVDQ